MLSSCVRGQIHYSHCRVFFDIADLWDMNTTCWNVMIPSYPALQFCRTPKGFFYNPRQYWAHHPQNSTRKGRYFHCSLLGNPERISSPCLFGSIPTSWSWQSPNRKEAAYPFDAFPPYARGLVRALSMDVVQALAALSVEGVGWKEGENQCIERKTWSFVEIIRSHLSVGVLQLASPPFAWVWKQCD